MHLVSRAIIYPVRHIYVWHTISVFAWLGDSGYASLDNYFVAGNRLHCPGYLPISLAFSQQLLLVSYDLSNDSFPAWDWHNLSHCEVHSTPKCLWGLWQCLHDWDVVPWPLVPEFSRLRMMLESYSSVSTVDEYSGEPSLSDRFKTLRLKSACLRGVFCFGSSVLSNLSKLRIPSLWIVIRVVNRVLHWPLKPFPVEFTLAVTSSVRPLLWSELCSKFSASINPAKSLRLVTSLQILLWTRTYYACLEGTLLGVVSAFRKPRPYLFHFSCSDILYWLWFLWVRFRNFIAIVSCH